MAQSQPQLCLIRNWAREGSSLPLPTEPDRFLVLDADSIAPEGSAFRRVAQKHCHQTCIGVAAKRAKPAVAVLVCQAGGVEVSVAGPGAQAAPCAKGQVVKVRFRE